MKISGGLWHCEDGEFKDGSCKFKKVEFKVVGGY